MSERPLILDNPRSERIRRVAALSGRSARKKSGLFLVEGPQSVRELIRFRPDSVVDVYYTKAAQERYPELEHEIVERVQWTHLVSEQVARQISDEAQGIIAVAESQAIAGGKDLSSVARECSGEHANRFMVVLPATQDPGNLGTIIRSADAMGAAGVIIGQRTCEPTNPKVVRATAGSLFHLPVIEAPFEETVAALREAGIALLGTALQSGSVSITELLAGEPGHSVLRDPHAWVFGNEAQGLDKDERQSCDLLVHIPMPGNAESLNAAAAAAVCLFSSSLETRPGTGQTGDRGKIR